MSRRELLAAVAVVFVVLAGCMGAPGGGDEGPSFDGNGPAESGGRPAASTATGAPTAAADAPSESGAEDDSAAANARTQVALVRTGTVQLRIQDFQEARNRLTSIARNEGGYVSDSGQTLHRGEGGNRTTGYLVVRVPADEFSSTLSAVREEGVVLREQTKTTDVSDQLVDLEARLSNLRAQRDRLRDFYERANTTDDLLQVEQRLSAVQGDVERLEAQKRALEDEVAYSTLRIELTEPGPGTPTPAPEYHETSLTTAFTESIGAILLMGRALLVTGAYALPYLLLGAPFAALYVGIRRRRRPSTGDDQSRTSEPPPVDDGGETTDGRDD